MINKIIKKMRKDSKLTQKELALKIGVAQTTLSGYETGYSNPIFDTILDISNTCGYEIVFINKKTKEHFAIKK